MPGALLSHPHPSVLSSDTSLVCSPLGGLVRLGPGPPRLFFREDGAQENYTQALQCGVCVPDPCLLFYPGDLGWT